MSGCQEEEREHVRGVFNKKVGMLEGILFFEDCQLCHPIPVSVCRYQWVSYTVSYPILCCCVVV